MSLITTPDIDVGDGHNEIASESSDSDDDPSFNSDQPSTSRPSSPADRAEFRS